MAQRLDIRTRRPHNRSPDHSYPGLAKAHMGFTDLIHLAVLLLGDKDGTEGTMFLEENGIDWESRNLEVNSAGEAGISRRGVSVVGYSFPDPAEVGSSNLPVPTRLF